MNGKIVVLTGGTSGIGQIAAEHLAGSGARIVLVARDRDRAAAALERLRRCGPGQDHAIFLADLSRLSEMKRVGAELAAAVPRIDVLINNAGAIYSSRQVVEGLERTFALNHLSYFVLTQLLKARLLAASPARIVSTSSDAHRGGTLDFADLQSELAYRGRFADWLRYGGRGFHVYARSKLCNILFTRALARRLAGTGVTANCLHPGFVATRFGNQAGGLISFGIRVAKNFALSPQQGAETLIYLASSPEIDGVSGEYFERCRPAETTPDARDPALAERLWIESARLAGFDG